MQRLHDGELGLGALARHYRGQPTAATFLLNRGDGASCRTTRARSMTGLTVPARSTAAVRVEPGRPKCASRATRSVTPDVHDRHLLRDPVDHAPDAHAHAGTTGWTDSLCVRRRGNWSTWRNGSRHRPNDLPPVIDDRRPSIHFAVHAATVHCKYRCYVSSMVRPRSHQRHAHDRGPPSANAEIGDVLLGRRRWSRARSPGRCGGEWTLVDVNVLVPRDAQAVQLSAGDDPPDARRGLSKDPDHDQRSRAHRWS